MRNRRLAVKVRRVRWDFRISSKWQWASGECSCGDKRKQAWVYKEKAKARCVNRTAVVVSLSFYCRPFDSVGSWLFNGVDVGLIWLCHRAWYLKIRVCWQWWPSLKWLDSPFLAGSAIWLCVFMFPSSDLLWSIFHCSYNPFKLHVNRPCLFYHKVILKIIISSIRIIFLYIWLSREMKRS